MFRIPSGAVNSVIKGRLVLHIIKSTRCTNFSNLFLK